jgi:dihydrofolate reductase
MASSDLPRGVGDPGGRGRTAQVRSAPGRGRLKAHRGNLISFGGGELAKQGLADEIHFWVNPAVWGSGDRAFHGRRVRMRLIGTTAFDSGVVLLSYRPIPNAQASATT